MRIREMVVMTQSSPPGAPCGMCRQTIAEFTDPSGHGELTIHAMNLAGEHRAYRFSELLPFAFLPSHLNHSGE